MFKTSCPNCGEKIEVINGQCSKCNYDIFDFMKKNGMIKNNKPAYDKLFICPNCGTIDAGENSIRLKCYECGSPYKATDIDRNLYWGNMLYYMDNEEEILKKYVGETIDWNIYNSYKENLNARIKQEDEIYKQKIDNEILFQNAKNNPKCPSVVQLQ